jgi:hypothetical protein
MSKIIDFYKKAEADPALKAELEAANKQFAGQKPEKAAVIAEAIRIAGKHGVRLEHADFEVEKGELDEAELDAVAGGCGPGPGTGNCGVISGPAW